MDMKRTRSTSQQIVHELRGVNRLLAENIPLPEVMRHLEISHKTFRRWGSQYGAIGPGDNARLKTSASSPQTGNNFDTNLAPPDAATKASTGKSNTI
jgi:hypothetical protein